MKSFEPLIWHSRLTFPTVKLPTLLHSSKAVAQRVATDPAVAEFAGDLELIQGSCRWKEQTSLLIHVSWAEFDDKYCTGVQHVFTQNSVHHVLLFVSDLGRWQSSPQTLLCWSCSLSSSSWWKGEKVSIYIYIYIYKVYILSHMFLCSSLPNAENPAVLKS